MLTAKVDLLIKRLEDQMGEKKEVCTFMIPA
jgi:hypothetical protein